ncbi:MAG: TetR/AcrR family transcriptional regulator [Pseudomonadota bacterium]|nr:TetR/AcrR family transcriptional regulator [Pseudomonadota bacterium]
MNPAVDTQQRILDSACELIHSRSYADVGVAAICHHAGVKKGSFYHFFPSKRDLTLAVLDSYYLQMKRNLLDVAFSPELPPLQRLQRFAQLLYEVQKSNVASTGYLFGCPFGNLAVELSTQDEPIRLKVAEIFSRLRTDFRRILDEAVKTGDLEGIDTEATAAAMLAYFEGVMMMAKTQNDPEVLHQLLPGVAAIRIYPADALL